MNSITAPTTFTLDYNFTHKICRCYGGLHKTGRLLVKAVCGKRFVGIHIETEPYMQEVVRHTKFGFCFTGLCSAVGNKSFEADSIRARA
jgi:hypothetical protein